VYFQDDIVPIGMKPWLKQLNIILDGTTFREYVWQSRVIMFTYFYIGRGSIVTFPNVRLLG
jgi:hypothetical protein